MRKGSKQKMSQWIVDKARTTARDKELMSGKFDEDTCLPPGHSYESYIYGPGVDSYNRLDGVLSLFYDEDEDRKSECMMAFGDAWSMCDDLWESLPYTRGILRSSTPALRQAMMTASELREWSALPSRITVWRGCYADNVAGLSWTLDEKVARRFPFLHRYSSDRSDALLLKTSVAKTRAVLKLARGEAEIVVIPTGKIDCKVIELPQ